MDLPSVAGTGIGHLWRVTIGTVGSWWALMSGKGAFVKILREGDTRCKRTITEINIKTNIFVTGNTRKTVSSDVQNWRNVRSHWVYKELLRFRERCRNEHNSNRVI